MLSDPDDPTPRRSREIAAARAGTGEPDGCARAGGGPLRRRRLGVAAATTAVLLAAAQGTAAQSPDANRQAGGDPWEPLRLLVGNWSGGIDGALGQGTGHRSYAFVMDGRYLVQRHASLRLPQPDSPAGDYHRELAVYSYDRQRRTIVLREFMEEGFVLTYHCATEPLRFVCTSEDVESGPGMRARLTIELEHEYRFRESFELADAGEELKLLFTNTWTRVPEPPGPA